jgi:hypothetical protein
MKEDPSNKNIRLTSPDSQTLREAMNLDLSPKSKTQDKGVSY